MKFVPMDKVKWEQGWKPYRNDGEEVEGLRDDSEYSQEFPWVGYVLGRLRCWPEDGGLRMYGYLTQLVLAEPEPEREYWYPVVALDRRALIARPSPCSFSPKDAPGMEIICIREKRPDGTWRVLSSEEMAEVLK